MAKLKRIYSTLPFITPALYDQFEVGSKWICLYGPIPLPATVLERNGAKLMRIFMDSMPPSHSLNEDALFDAEFTNEPTLVSLIK
jgi:hypothetical protein